MPQAPVRGLSDHRRARPAPASTKDGHDHDDTDTWHVTGGVDTHSDIHLAAAVDHLGGVLGAAQFRTPTAGYRKLLAVLAPAAGSVHAGIDGVLPGAAWLVTEPVMRPRVRKPAATAGWGPARQEADPRW